MAFTMEVSFAEVPQATRNLVLMDGWSAIVGFVEAQARRAGHRTRPVADLKTSLWRAMRDGAEPAQGILATSMGFTAGWTVEVRAAPPALTPVIIEIGWSNPMRRVFQAISVPAGVICGVLALAGYGYGIWATIFSSEHVYRPSRASEAKLLLLGFIVVPSIAGFGVWAILEGIGWAIGQFFVQAGRFGLSKAEEIELGNRCATLIRIATPAGRTEAQERWDEALRIAAQAGEQAASATTADEAREAFRRFKAAVDTASPIGAALNRESDLTRLRQEQDQIRQRLHALLR